MNEVLNTTGLLNGCKILTMQGYTPIADLKAGDRIITRNGMRKLRALTKTTQAMRPIAVGCGTLGYSRPSQDMLVAPDQEVMVRDWRAEVLFGADQVIMPIERLIDGKYIAQKSELAEHELFELIFDEEEVFYADGVEIISKLTVAADDGLLNAA